MYDIFYRIFIYSSAFWNFLASSISTNILHIVGVLTQKHFTNSTVSNPCNNCQNSHFYMSFSLVPNSSFPPFCWVLKLKKIHTQKKNFPVFRSLNFNKFCENFCGKHEFKRWKMSLVLNEPKKNYYMEINCIIKLKIADNFEDVYTWKMRGN